MNKCKFLTIFSTIIITILLLGCNPYIIARLTGTIGSGMSAFYVNIAFDLCTPSSTGSGDSFRLIIKLDNAAGEYIEFTLAPTNPSGSSLIQMYALTNYNIDGNNNQFAGAVMLGSALQPINASGGQFKLDVLSTSGSTVTAIQGAYQINPEGGGITDGTFICQPRM